jgi:FKBP-type peptidyl-prolyl cis-trans isomerase FkpA
MKIKLYIALFLIAVCFQCHSRHQYVPVSEDEVRKTQEALVGANRLLVQKDKEKIEKYIREHHLALRETESGLWYSISKEGTGSLVKEKMTVTLKYRVSLIDGTPCYSSDSLGVKQFMVGQGGVESGLEEGVLYLKKGSKALFIMPPHLAYGLPGDGNKIPARSILVYEVEVTNVEP